MSILYLDTEFNGHRGELISMALTSNAISWYAAQEIAGPIDPWVAENVIPKLERKPLHPDDFRESFRHFILKYDDPEIVCDYHADAEHFCRMLSGPTYETSLDFPCRLLILKTPPGQPVSKNPHNALADAVALRDWHLAEMIAQA